MDRERVSGNRGDEMTTGGGGGGEWGITEEWNGRPSILEIAEDADNLNRYIQSLLRTNPFRTEGEQVLSDFDNAE